MRIRSVLGFIALTAAALANAPNDASARPTGPMLVCDTYPNSPLCEGTSATCALCHDSTVPGAVAWNSFGISVFGALAGTAFDEGLVSALAAVESVDSDNDGRSNLEEINEGSLPGDPGSVKQPPLVPRGVENPSYDIGVYDDGFAYRRAAIAFCGRSPTYKELQQLSSSADRYAELHNKVQSCLESTYWRESMLPRLADPKIRPIDRFEMWVWDYALFRYAMSGSRDVRDLVQADYHVVTDGSGNLRKVEGVIAAFSDRTCTTNDDCNAWEKCGKPTGSSTSLCAPIYGAQPLDPSMRAGMLTTHWFHFYNTMFSALPRQTAAQAYRAYTDLDIARQQGLYPTDGYEAFDVDDKGILQEECWQCHSTLERLSYPFASHYGIGGDTSSQFNANRPVALGLWDHPDEAPTGVIFGVEVSSIRDWGAVVAASDQFARMVTRMLWKHALGREPELEDFGTFTALWKSLAELNYDAERLIHAIVDTDAFGAP